VIGAGNQSDTASASSDTFDPDTSNNSASVVTITVRPADTTPPVTTAAVNGTVGDNGWFKAGSPVRLTLSATDDFSGVATTNYTINGGSVVTYTGPVTFGNGNYHVTFYSVDGAGNVEAPSAIDFKVDQTLPTVAIGGVTNGAVYFLHGVPTPSFTATDALSGISTQVATLTAPTTASGAGIYTYVVTATDRAGNVTNATATYLVIYRFVGFLSPFAGTTFKRGRVIPVAFFLLDNGYAPVANAKGSLYVDGTKLGDFIYGGLGIYYFNLSTSGLSLGRHTLTAKLDDTTAHNVDVYIVR
jgi:hypothetical protein